MVNVVLVEDNKSVLKIIVKKLLLEFNENITITTFCNPLKALQNIPEMNPVPELIITDYMMFDMDGVTLIENLRKLNLKTKYILLTSFRDINLARECLEKDIEILNKETNIDLLIGVIYNVQHSCS